MSRFSDAQYELVYAMIEYVVAERGFGPDEERTLTSRVFADDGLWSSEFWLPVLEFVQEHADEIGLDG